MKPQFKNTEALVTLLKEKCILTRAEILEEIKDLREAQAKGRKQ